jgi:hypothetical protein
MLPSRRRAVAACFLTALTLSIAFAGVAVVSVFYRASLRGEPFNHAWQLAGGAFSAEWMVPAANGSVSGFGNPGFRVVRRDPWDIALRPRYRAAGTLRVLVVPLWIPTLLTAAACWRLAVLLRRHTDPGRCPCGYPLVGLSRGAACPECGRVADATPPVTR